MSLPEYSLPKSPTISGASMVTEPRVTAPTPEASVSASRRRLPPPEVVTFALTFTLLMAASFRLTPDCMVTAVLTVMSLSACNSTVPDVKPVNSVTSSVPVTPVASPKASVGSPGTVSSPSRVPAPACTVMLSGSSSRVPARPSGASSATLPRNSSACLPDTSTSPPLPPWAPPLTEAWPW